jgi:ERCC4-type nuclease
MTWQVDIREPANIIDFFKQMGATTEALQVGDYVFDGKVGFERKCDDFLNYGSVLRQAGELQTTYPFAYLLVEKDLEHIIATAKKTYTKDQTNQIIGMVASLCVRGTPPIFCSNISLLLSVMQEIASKSLDGKPRAPIPRAIQRRQFDNYSTAVSVLLGFPGLGAEKAKMILYKYPTLREALTVILNSPDELTKLPGIGRGIVDKINSTLDSNPSQSLDEKKPDEIFG